MNLSEISKRKSEMIDIKPSPNVPLPKIVIPQLSGQIEKWSEFHDLYQSLVHENATLSLPSPVRLV